MCTQTGPRASDKGKTFRAPFLQIKRLARCQGVPALEVVYSSAMFFLWLRNCFHPLGMEHSFRFLFSLENWGGNNFILHSCLRRFLPSRERVVLAAGEAKQLLRPPSVLRRHFLNATRGSCFAHRSLFLSRLSSFPDLLMLANYAR